MVEDNPADLFLIRQALVLHGITGDVAVMQDGEAGFDFVEAAERGDTPAPDLFILDLSLPKRSGPELLERIKAGLRCSRSKIVIASSSRSPSDRAIAAQFGADCYFVKPSSFDEFMKLGALVAELLHPAHEDV